MLLGCIDFICVSTLTILYNQKRSGNYRNILSNEVADSSYDFRNCMMILMHLCTTIQVKTIKPLIQVLTIRATLYWTFKLSISCCLLFMLLYCIDLIFVSTLKYFIIWKEAWITTKSSRTKSRRASSILETVMIKSIISYRTNWSFM